MTSVEQLPDTLVDPDLTHKCSHNRHPEHRHNCRKKASFMLVWTCPECGEHRVPFCSRHLEDAFPYYLDDGAWCGCTAHDYPHCGNGEGSSALGVGMNNDETGLPEELLSFIPDGSGPFAPSEVALTFGWTIQMVHEKCRLGEIVSIGEGKSRRISRAAVISYLRAEAAKTNNPRPGL